MARKSRYVPVVIERLFKCLVLAFQGLPATLCLPAYFVFNRSFDNLTLFYHYLLPMPLIVMAVLSISLKFLRPLSIFCTLLIALTLLLPFGRDLLMNAPDPSTLSDAPLKIVTYNALGENEKVHLFNSWLKTKQPDIVAIEEVNEAQLYNIRTLANTYPYSTLTDTTNDVIIISRLPIIAHKRIAAPGTDRSIIYARIAAPQGAVDVYALHADTVRTDALWLRRNDYLALAATIIDPGAERIVVLGDFNASSWNYFYNSLAVAGNLHTEPKLFPPITRIVSTREGKPVGASVDHILVNSAHEISDCRTYEPMGSDHLPLMCDIRFGNQK